MGCSSSKNEVTPHTPQAPSTDDSTPINEENQAILDKYEIGECLGSGSFGQVCKAFLKKDKNEERAVKLIPNGTSGAENKATFETEIQMMQLVSHENIIKFYDFYEDPHFFYVVMELCVGGEVFAKIVEMKRFGEKMAASMGKQMLLAIEYIHSKYIIHRDVKAENFMLSGPEVTSTIKMIDFGMATEFEEGETLVELCGSPHYLSPELVGQRYNNSADIWAFGVLMYLLMYGHYPYDAKHPRDLMIKIITELVVWQTKAQLTPPCLDFLKGCLNRSPRDRLTASQCLQHDWIVQGNMPETPDTEISPEVVRNAHKKVTATRQKVDPKMDEIRAKKLKEIDEDRKRGIRQGQWVGKGAASKQEYRDKPEFVRRDNKLESAPGSIQAHIDLVKLEMDGKTGEESAEVAELKEVSRRGRRARTVTDAKVLAEKYQITKQEEQHLVALYKEKSMLMNQNDKGMGGIVPATGGCLPGTLQ